jgi:hypothetical protein
MRRLVLIVLGHVLMVDLQRSCFVLTSFFCVRCSAVAWVLYHLTRRPAGKIPPVVKGMPLIGSAVRFGQDPINLMLESRKVS